MSGIRASAAFTGPGLVRLVLLACVATVSPVAVHAWAGDVVTLESGLQPLDPSTLAVTADKALPEANRPLVVSKTPIPVVPGLPLSNREKAAFGDQATTVTVLPSADGTQSPSVSWSGYARAGVVYHGSN